MSYDNIPLQYSSSGPTGGWKTYVNIVVGQGSSVIDFEFVYTGYHMVKVRILTVPVGGAVVFQLSLEHHLKSYSP